MAPLCELEKRRSVQKRLTWERRYVLLLFMVSDMEMLEEIDAGLAHAAALLLAAADRQHVHIQASEDAAEIAAMSKALEGTVRGLRLTYALRMKLRRDARKAEREEADAKIQRDKEQVRARKQQLGAAVRGLLPSEGDHENYDEGSDFDWDLLEAINDEALSEAFLTEDLGDQAASILKKLGYEITSEGRVRLIPPPQGEGDRKAVEGASSAQPAACSSA